MKHLFSIILLTFACIYSLSGTEFTISSYNCGGLTNHYDYLRAAAMETLMQERHLAEPKLMSLNENIQKLGLKILFSKDPLETSLAQQEWEQKGYEKLFKHLTKAPILDGSINTKWNAKTEETITSYKIRPVIIHDQNVSERLAQHLTDLTKNPSADREEQLQEARALMAQRIFAYHITQDIICLQEADYLDTSMFPEKYDVRFSTTDHSKNGIAWNQERFELVEYIGDVLERGIVALLCDKDTGQTIAIASGHITGCNPFHVETDPKTGNKDSATGDKELQAIIGLLDSLEADIKIIGMDSNVTALHPRLNILKDAAYQLDCDNYLEPTCTNPYQVLNTRIDWISFKSSLNDISIENIPVLSIGLNNLQTNMSDHKPIAAKIIYGSNEPRTSNQ